MRASVGELESDVALSKDATYKRALGTDESKPFKIEHPKLDQFQVMDFRRFSTRK